VEPDFPISLFDLLSQYSVPAWLLLCLSTAVVFVILSKLPIAGHEESEEDGRRDPDPKQSD
jgi:hypothetical protein